MSIAEEDILWKLSWLQFTIVAENSHCLWCKESQLLMLQFWTACGHLTYVHLVRVVAREERWGRLCYLLNSRKDSLSLFEFGFKWRYFTCKQEKMQQFKIFPVSPFLDLHRNTGALLPQNALQFLVQHHSLASTGSFGKLRTRILSSRPFNHIYLHWCSVLTLVKSYDLHVSWPYALNSWPVMHLSMHFRQWKWWGFKHNASISESQENGDIQSDVVVWIAGGAELHYLRCPHG